MINVYNPIETLKGWYEAGICGILIAPREWLLNPVTRNFNTGIIDIIPPLEDPLTYFKLEFTPDTYDYDEKAKDNKNGPYFETHLTGVINDITPELLMILQTYRYHEFVAIVTDRQKRKKVIGDKHTGLSLHYSNKESSSQGGNQNVLIEMAMTFEDAAPFIAIPE